MNIKDMTNEQKSHFWALFTNDHPIISYDVNGEGSLSMRNYYADLSGFQIVKDFMQSKWSELWERYLGKQHEKTYYACLYNEDKPFTNGFNAQLSLNNLLEFLLQNTNEWGWKECKKPCCTECIPQDGNCILDKNVYKVKHPALLFAEGLKEER